MRTLLLASLVLFSSCDKSDPAKPASPSPMAAAPAASSAASATPAVDYLAIRKAMVAEVCACTDPACLTTASAKYTGVIQKEDMTKLGHDEIQATGRLSQQMLDCSNKILNKGAPATASATIPPVGVPACDDLLAHFTSCIEPKLPESARQSTHETYRALFAQMADKAKDPANKQAVGDACTQMTAKMKEAASALGCTW